MKTFIKKFNFSTLIIPEIAANKIHPSVNILTTAANKLDKDVNLFLYGNKVNDELINQAKKIKGIKTIYTFEHEKMDNPPAETLSWFLYELQKKQKFDNLITSSTNFGKNFLPRLGGYLDIQPISDVSSIEGQNSFKRFFYAGNALSSIESSQSPNLLTIRLTSFETSAQDDSNNPNIVNLNSDLKENPELRSAKFVKDLVSETEKIELTAAKVVISGGRALKSKENFKILEDLAACFKNSALGASRAAVDAGYVPNDLQVGQTGKVVAPDLYFAIGISGAIQHVAGMKDSKVIVAINSDPDAPIFSIANYGLVGDLFKIIPELTEKIKKL